MTMQFFRNIFDDESILNNVTEDANCEYFCIFCLDVFKDKEEAKRHYQHHLGYYPMTCSLCGQGATDMTEFLKHHTDVHPEAEKGRYKRKENGSIEKWLNGFLYAQATIIRAFPAREQCPVCDKVFTREQILAARPRRCTVNRRIDHVHRHLCYLPYECLKCKEEGKEFLVAYFESKAHSHIKLKHPDVDESDSRWFIFQKTTTIPQLDDYVSGFFEKFGISMEFERRPIKKQARESISASDFLAAYKINSPSRIENFSDDSSTNQMNSSNPSNVVICDDDDNGSNRNPKDLTKNCVDEDEMVIDVSPSHIGCVKQGDDTLGSEYFCLFCPKTFSSNIEAYPHYSEHLGYHPVICLLCDDKFSDIESFTSHHNLQHSDKTDLFYEIRENDKIEKWVEDFLESQLSKESRQQILACSCGSCCLVCKILTPGSNEFNGNQPCYDHTGDDIHFSDHIHKHLRYCTYECNLCTKTGKVTKITNLDATAMNHLTSVHKVEGATMYQLCKAFTKTLSISKVEKFIAESIHIKRTMERNFRTQLFEEIKSNHRTSVPTKNKLNGLYKPTLPLDDHHENTNHNIPHVRVEGGRVVNLPSSVSVRAVQQRRLNGNGDLTSLLSKKRIRAPSLRMMETCMHCQIEFPSKALLRKHHLEHHPGLSLAYKTQEKTLLANRTSVAV